MRFMKLSGRLFVAVAALVAAGGAKAQATPAMGKALYEEARAAKDAGNYVLALRKDEAACRLGQSYSCYYAATAYHGGSPATAVNPAKALAHYVRACDLDDEHSEACEEVGNFLTGGKGGIAKDSVRARTYYKRACDISGSHGHGCEPFARLIREAGGKENPPLSRPYYMRACEGYQTAGCLNAYLVTFVGWYGPKDHIKARGFAVRGCHDSRNALDSEAQAELCSAAAAMFRNGSGGAKDLKTSAMFYRRSCDAGNAGGCEELAAHYWKGEGVAVDQKAALGLLRRSCDMGGASACAHLKK